jgi:putative photosynthetic complex assembly protein 2
MALFRMSLQTSLYHELAILIGALMLWGLSREAEFAVAFWTYMVLWAMHESARINVFFRGPPYQRRMAT